jgi:hypothetical protein
MHEMISVKPASADQLFSPQGPADRTRGMNRGALRDLALFALEIVIPVALIDVVAVLTMAGWLSDLAILDIPFYEWSPIMCAASVLVVLNSGPLLMRTSGKDTGQE